MAGRITTNQVQLGDSATASQNFHLQTNVDGTLNLNRGNVGAAIAALFQIDSLGRWGIGKTPAWTLSVSDATACVLELEERDVNKSSFIVQDADILAVRRNSIGAGNSLAIDAASNVTVNTNTGALGYGAGAGGTVTQATSKTTTVTLNRPTGQITMNAALLAAGASVVFVVNNSLVTTSDLILVNAAGNANYRVECVFATTAQFAIRVTNTTAGGISEALVINFAIIRGAIS